MERYPNINILLNLPRDYIPKAEFELRTYCYILRLNPKFIYGSHYEAAHIYYGPPPDRDYPIRIHFDPQADSFFGGAELYPLEKVNFCRFGADHVPFLFSMGGAIFSLTQESCILRKDIVASGFYFLTCWHEYVFSERGIPRGRVDYKESLQYRWDFIETPVVDIYCRILHFIMQDYLPEFIRDISWGMDHRFAMSLSHDIDYYNFWDAASIKSTRKYNAKSFRDRPIRATYKLLGHYWHKNILHAHERQLEKLVQREKEMGVSSTWFLMARTDFPDERQNYIGDNTARSRLTALLNQQDVGLHGSPDAAFNLSILKAELQILRDLGFNPSGFRSHYLHFDYQKSFSNLEAAGIKYDSTLGYWENIGFRAGISFPFYPFNIKENRPFRVLEIPLIVMDTTLHSPRAMNLSMAAGKRALNRLTDIAATYQSHISLLWHNTTFDPVDYPGWGNLYWTTINHALKKQAWVTSLNEIYEEWVTLSY
ncbi:MAG: polysaccharide deacetylase family protein [Candidatus Cloacimonetes bacterium]|nr:polysaccharide deacetylase family protein [Candidatus Cloacimonadota bacterium]